MLDRPGRERTAPADGTAERSITTELPGRGPGDDRARLRAARRLGRPFDRQSSFVVGFVATVGVLLAVALGAAVYSVRSTLVLVFLALFIAVGMEPVVGFFTRHRVRRSIAVLLVVILGAGVVAAFVYSAISPMEHEINQLTVQVPKWRAEVGSGKGTVGRVARDLHLSYYLSGSGSKSLTSGLASGALGAGKEVLSAVSSFLVAGVSGSRSCWTTYWPAWAATCSPTSSRRSSPASAPTSGRRSSGSHIRYCSLF